MEIIGLLIVLLLFLPGLLSFFLTPVVYGLSLLHVVFGDSIPLVNSSRFRKPILFVLLLGPACFWTSLIVYAYAMGGENGGLSLDDFYYSFWALAFGVAYAFAYTKVTGRKHTKNVNTAFDLRLQKGQKIAFSFLAALTVLSIILKPAITGDYKTRRFISTYYEEFTFLPIFLAAIYIVYFGALGRFYSNGQVSRTIFNFFALLPIVIVVLGFSLFFR